MYGKYLELWKEFFDNLTDLAYITDDAGKIVWVNRIAEKITGTALDSLIGHDFRPLFIDSDIQSLFEIYSRTLQGESLHNILTLKTGITCQFSSIPWRDEQGRIKGTFGIGRDISEKLAMEAELKESHTIFEQLYLQSEKSTQILDRDGWCIRINPKLSEYFGVQPKDIEGRKYNILEDGEIIRTGVIEKLKRVFEHKETVSWEVNFDIGYASETTGVKVSKPLKRWFYNVAYPILDENGDVLYVVVQHEDVTEHKELQRINSERNAYVNAILETTRDGLWVTDTEGYLIDVNQAYSELSGYTKDELIGMHINNLDAIEERNVTRARIEKIMARGYDLFETVHRKKNGDLFDTEMSVSFVPGDHPIFIAFCRDISERKKSEKELLSKQYYLEKAQEIGEIGTWEMDLLSGGITWTKENYRIFGVAYQEKVDYQRFLNFVHPEDRNYVDEAWVQGLKERRYDIEHRILVNNQEKWVREKADFIYNDQNEPVRVIGVTQDITHRVQTEHKLSESEHHYKMMFMNMPNGFAFHKIITDQDGHAVDFQFLDVNEQYEHITGLQRSQIIGKTIKEIMPEIVNDSFGWIECYGDVALNEKAAAFEAYSEAMGKWFQVNAYCPRRGYFAAIINDVTEKKESETVQKQLEIQLQQTQKLESIGQLASGIAHDFNNILASLYGFTDVALFETEKGTKAHTALVEIQKGSQRAASLVRQILAFSRKQSFVPRKINFTETVSDLYKMLRRLIGEDVEFNMDLSREDLIILADPSQIEQIIINLVVNARDAIRANEDGTSKYIELRTRVEAVSENSIMEMSPDQEGNYVLLTIRDTGIGMTQDTLDHMFEPFYTTKEEGKGTGLGLAMVYGIVRQNKGFITAESAPGSGTEFRIYWPLLNEQRIMPDEKKIQPEAVTGNEVILYAEDDEMVRQVTTYLIEEQGYHVIPCSDGKEALAKAADLNYQFDLLLSDITMPRIGGLELVTSLKEKVPDLKFILCTGYFENVKEIPQVQNEELQILHKPFSPATLTKAIRRVLNK